MLFNTMTIRRYLRIKQASKGKPLRLVSEWIVHCKEIEGERHNEQLPPSELGFWDYDRSIPAEVAFEKLRDTLIASREDFISKLQEEVNELKQLKFKIGKQEFELNEE